MTKVTEIRWKCDWTMCEVVSPVVTEIAPLGWKTIPEHPGSGLVYPIYHFCCKPHRDAWKEWIDKRTQKGREEKILLGDYKVTTTCMACLQGTCTIEGHHT